VESFQPFVKIPVPERFQSKVVPSAHASAQELLSLLFSQNISLGMENK